MNHVLTIGDVLIAGGWVLGIAIVIGICLGILWFMGQGWNH